MSPNEKCLTEKSGNIKLFYHDDTSYKSWPTSPVLGTSNLKHFSYKASSAYNLNIMCSELGTINDLRPMSSMGKIYSTHL